MLRLSALIFSFLFVTIDCFGFRGFHYKGRQEPIVKNGRLLSEKWIEQPLDHFDVRNNRTWKMRYYENDEFFVNNGPIFIMLGGEWAISTGYLQTGQLYLNAKNHQGMMYYTEHRYYGKSRPVENTTVENLLFLNVDQALADVAYFIETKKKELKLFNSKVFVFGGSYSGNMAAWIRIKYPHLIQGAVASSAPVAAKADFFEYYEVVLNSLAKYNQTCIDNIKEAFTVVENYLKNSTGREELKEKFGLCDVPDVSVKVEISWFMNSIAEIFAGIVQYNKVYSSSKSDISEVCDNMMSSEYATSFDRLAAIVKDSNTRCQDWRYRSFLEIYQNTAWDSEAGGSIMRLWYYQTCTEYGYYQTSNSNNSIFGSLFTLDFFTQICSDLYGKYYDENLLIKSVRRTNLMYGGNTPDVKNVIFSNGNVDPWHQLSVLQDLNEHSPAILINGSSHCEDLGTDKPQDVPGLKQAREKIRSTIKNWMNDI